MRIFIPCVVYFCNLCFHFSKPALISCIHCFAINICGFAYNENSVISVAWRFYSSVCVYYHYSPSSPLPLLPPALISSISAHDSRSTNMAFSSRFSFWEQKGSLIWTFHRSLTPHGITVFYCVLTCVSLDMDGLYHIIWWLSLMYKYML